MLQETFYPCAFVNTSRDFYALTDLESDSERKETGGKVTKLIARGIAKNNATRRCNADQLRIG
ncbi:hypothetical protein CRI67_24055 [Escherichia sp. E4702]|nr:hypothetical protein CRI67_24055 [Escherichia sp. E4702]